MVVLKLPHTFSTLAAMDIKSPRKNLGEILPVKAIYSRIPSVMVKSRNSCKKDGMSQAALLA
jgi:hypothetical protein